MDRERQFNDASWLVVMLVFSGLALSTGAGAVAVSTGPAEINFESAAPYYEPQTAVVAAGTPIQWVNATASHHSVRHDGCLTGGPCAFQSIPVPPDSSFSIAPLAPGRYAYHCELHPIMRGTLIVVEPFLQSEGIMSGKEQEQVR